MCKKQTLIKWGLRLIQCFTLFVFLFIFFMIYCVWKSMPEGYQPVTIQTANKSITVKAEMALTPEQQALGLMFRQKLPFDEGMLFVFQTEQIISMWMKNTYLPLDMIFFDDNHTIVHIYQNARPHDLSIISSRVPVLGVLEVNAGFVQKNHIKLGDKINHPYIVKD